MPEHEPPMQFFSVEALEAVLESTIKRALSARAKELGHSDEWRGERYDPGNPADVDQLMDELGLSTFDFETGNPEMEEKCRALARALLIKYMDVHAKDSITPGRSDFEPMKVDLKDPNVKPLRQAPYR